ncbi:MAG: mercuric ion binding protein [Cellvibrionaceae bacterium]|jgi:mercuric ion binding protein
MKKIALLVSAAALMVTMSMIGTKVFPVAQAASAAASAAESAALQQTSTFTIEKMTCAACPITVRKAMEGVEGVQKVTVDFGQKTATAIYDPSVTTIEQIAAASTNAGYPARPHS